jgi:hypothetical protein
MGTLKYRDGGKDFHVFSSYSHPPCSKHATCMHLHRGHLSTKKICGGKEYMHGLINYIDTTAKCRHLKKFTGKRDFAAGVNHSS